jgi:hypothetical protein
MALRVTDATDENGQSIVPSKYRITDQFKLDYLKKQMTRWGNPWLNHHSLVFRVVVFSKNKPFTSNTLS